MTATVAPESVLDVPGAPRGVRWRIELVGAGLVVTLVGWAFLVGATSGGDAGPIVFVLLASAGAVVAAQLLSAVSAWIVPTTVSLSAVVLFLASPHGILSGRPGPFGLS